MAAADYVMGGCTFLDGCALRCTRFRSDADSSVTCGYCAHDVSAHSILGFSQDGRLTLLPSAVVQPETVPVVLKESTDEERKQLFMTKPRVSMNLKRKSMGDHGDSRRSIGGRSAQSLPVKNVMPKLIAMMRRDDIPQSEFDHVELDRNYTKDYPLTTSDALTFHLKMNTNNGEAYAKKWYLFTRLSNKSLKPTQYWSSNWPSERTIASLCQQKHLYVLPDCYDDELSGFVTSEEIEESNYVEVLESSASSSSSS